MDYKFFSTKTLKQEEDFDALFPKIPMESRKSMLNYRPKIIDTHNPKVLRDYKRKRFKGYGGLRPFFTDPLHH